MADADVSMSDSKANPNMVAEQGTNVTAEAAAANNFVTSQMLSNAMLNVKALIESEIEEKFKDFGKAFGNNLEAKIKSKEEIMNKKIEFESNDVDRPEK